MPIDNPERYGRIKDNVNVLLAGVQTRVVSLIVENELNDSREGNIQRTLHSTHAEVEAINERFKQHEKDTSQVMTNLRAEMEELLLTLGLTEEQEIVLLGRVDASTDELHALSTAGIEIEENLKRVTDMLGKLLD